MRFDMALAGSRPLMTPLVITDDESLLNMQ